MRGYFFIAFLLLVFNFGCSSKEKTTTSDNVANELVELKITRKHKNERIIEAELKADLTLQKRKTPSGNKIEDLSSQIDRNIKAIISATEIGLLKIDESFKGDLIYPEKLDKKTNLGNGLALWVDLKESGQKTNFDFVSSIRNLSEIFDEGINIKTIEVFQNGQMIESTHLVDFMAADKEAHSEWFCQWMKFPGVGMTLISLRRKSFTQIVSERGRFFEDTTEKILGHNKNYDIQFNQSLSSWAGQITKFGDLAMTGHNGLSVGDVNGDGRDDFYVCEAGSIPNRLYLQQEDGTAIDSSKESGVDWYEDSRSSLFVDLDNDGDQDLVVATIAMIVFVKIMGRVFSE